MELETEQSEIAWRSRLDEVGTALASAFGEPDTAPLQLVPSSLSASDATVSALRASLRQHGVRTTLLLPRATLPTLVGRGGASRWRRITAGDRDWRFDTRIASSRYVVIADVNAGLRQGPFVLDIPSRFLHPADRLALAARPDRLRLLADIASVTLPSRCVVLTQVANGWLTFVTRDPVAAELWSLASAERFLDQRLEMQGPWEDVTVQRATELELGARIPAEIRTNAHHVTDLPAAARNVLYSISQRLGVEPPAV